MTVPEVRNPFEHMSRAREAETQGNMRAAESEWKAAVIAADSLPLLEYKRNYRLELLRYSYNPEYQAQPGVSEQKLRDVFCELLALPFTTRMHLSSFYARHHALPEAHEACEQAFSFGMDALAREHKALDDFYKRSQIVRETLGNALGPENLPAIFEEHFDTLDVDGDGFIHDSELQQARFNLELPAECQQMVRYLIENYAQLEASHKDEWPVDIRGISKDDVKTHQAQKNSSWKRMRKPE